MRKLYEETLRNAGARSTRAKQEIFGYLLSAPRPVLPKTIMAALSDINKSTVYRVLEQFAELNIAHIVPHGFKTCYEVSDIFQPHHHYVVCEKCRCTVAAHSHDIEQLAEKLTRQAGMTPTSHQFELYGICDKCKITNPLIKWADNRYKISQ